MVAIGPAALATLFEPIEKATYNDINSIKPLIKALRFTLVDRDMVAGMLTAIKSFVEHAFSKGEQEIETIEYDNYKLLVRNFHTYYIVVVVSGSVSAEFKSMLTDLLLNFAERYKITARNDMDGETVEHNSKALAAHLHEYIEIDQ